MSGEDAEAFAESNYVVCVRCGGSPALYSTLVEHLKLCKKCYAERIIVPPPGQTRCEECEGKGKWSCLACGGCGTVECDLGHEHDCRDCDGNGANTSCESCSGVGWIPAEEVAA